jgi:hypothetical protein
MPFATIFVFTFAFGEAPAAFRAAGHRPVVVRLLRFAALPDHSDSHKN